MLSNQPFFEMLHPPFHNKDTEFLKDALVGGGMETVFTLYMVHRKNVVLLSVLRHGLWAPFYGMVRSIFYNIIVNWDGFISSMRGGQESILTHEPLE